MNTITKTFQDDTELHLIADETHEFLLTTKEVALGYGVSHKTINRHKQNQSDELIEGKHWVAQSLSTPGGQQKQTLWTKRGLVRLGFFIRSERAKKFRDWCEDLVLKELDTSLGYSEPSLGVPDIRDELDQEFFRRRYGSFNPMAQFEILHNGIRAYAYACTRHGFLISSLELSRLLGVAPSTLRVLQHYHKAKTLHEGNHYLRFKESNISMWTREGAGWLALHSGDGTFAKQLFSGKVDSLRNDIVSLRLRSQELIDHALGVDEQEAAL